MMYITAIGFMVAIDGYGKQLYITNSFAKIINLISRLNRLMIGFKMSVVLKCLPALKP